jgi:methylaspartate ammonia-lyase
MKVILKQDVEKLGKAGDVVKVAPGYGRNYLVPKKFALEATPGNIKIAELEKVAKPFPLRIEGPVDLGTKQAQIDALAELCRRLRAAGVNVQIVADEWCNTYQDVIDFTEARAGDMVQIKTPDLGGINNSIEAVLYCRAHGMGAYLGGTCNETERSAQVCIHVALATRPIQILAKPGMGVDEAFEVVYNEMQRTIALVRARHNDR